VEGREHYATTNVQLPVMNTSAESFDAQSTLEAQLCESLLRLHGPMISGDDLRITLGYPSKDAFRQAFVRKTVPVPVFDIEHRRGKFALTQDVAAWLAAQRERARQVGDSSEREAP
jgi:hypothetical protein